MTRFGIALAVTLVAAGCRGAPCRSSTVLLEVSFAAGLQSAVELDVVLSVDGAPAQHSSITRDAAGAGGTLEIDVPGYAQARQLSVRVDAIVDHVRVGSGGKLIALAPSCTVDALAVEPISCTPVDGQNRTFVDPVDGSDDPGYGGGTGLCANRTLTFALGHAPGALELAPAVYQAPVEKLPFVLNGTQRLDCAGATLLGSAYYDPAGVEVTVVFAGASNKLDGCKVVGGQYSLLCVDVESAGTGTDGHVVTNCDISECPASTGKGANIQVNPSGDRLTVSNSTLHDGFTGIAWFGGAHAGTITGNTFTGLRSSDIFCEATSPSPAIVGSGNQHDAPVAACYSCQNCPF